MIHFLTGVPGSGKGYVSTIQIEHELAHGSRVILTDSAIRLEPWLRNVSNRSSWAKGSGSKFQPELGLLGYLQEKYGETFSAAERIYLFGHDEAKEFYLRRYDLAQKKWILLDAERDSKGRIERFNTLIKTHGSLTITDEFWASAGSRDWANTAQGLIFYAAQHRKFGDEWFIVTQNTKQIDTALRGLAHDTWVCENHGNKQWGPFQRPDKITVAVYDKIPSGPQASPLRRMVYTLDKRGLGSCFDTAAGTGVTGGGAADLNAKKRGLPFWVLCLCVVGLILLLSQSFKVFGWGASKLLPARAASSSPGSGIVVTNEVPAARSGFTETVSGMFKSSRATGTNLALASVTEGALLYTGHMFDGQKVFAMFSDGSLRPVRQGLRKGDSGRMWIDGIEYETKRPEFDLPSPVFDAASGIQFPDEAVERPRVTVTVIGQGRALQPIPKRENLLQNW